MTTVYIKQNGTKVTVEVTEEMAEQLKACRREVWRNEAKEEYHTTSLDSIEENGSIFADPMLSIEDSMIGREDKSEQRRKLKKALTQLTPGQRKLIYYIYVKKIPQKAIAEYLGIAKSSMSERMTTIYKHLKKYFEEN